jgi:hypothetical protein
MAKSTSLMFPQNVNNQSVTILPADTTTPKVCFTAHATNDSNVKSMIATSNDTAAMNIAIYICRSAVDYLLACINVPTLSGTNGTAPAIDLLNAAGMPALPLDPVGKRYIPMEAGDTLKVGVLVAVTTAKTVTVNVLGEDF